MVGTYTIPNTTLITIFSVDEADVQKGMRRRKEVGMCASRGKDVPNSGYHPSHLGIWSEYSDRIFAAQTPACTTLPGQPRPKVCNEEAAKSLMWVRFAWSQLSIALNALAGMPRVAD